MFKKRKKEMLFCLFCFLLLFVCCLGQKESWCDSSVPVEFLRVYRTDMVNAVLNLPMTVFCNNSPTCSYLDIYDALKRQNQTKRSIS